MNIADLIRDTIVGLCKANGPYNGQIEIDGIICISGPQEGQQMVIKVHEYFDGLIQEDMERWIDENKRNLSTPNNFQPVNVKSEPLLSPSIDQSFVGSITSVDVYNSPDVKVSTKLSCSPAVEYPESLNPVQLVDEEDFKSPKDCLLSLVECRLCFKSFETQESLAAHNESVHNLFTCRSCLKTFTSRSNLERHSRLHTGHKPYCCMICNKAFSRKDHLSNHMTKHAFKCNTCSKKFNDYFSLSSHFTYGHGLTLTNVCQLCNKGFSNSVSYEDHLATHQEFSRQDLVRKSSILGTNGMQRFVCRVCSFVSQDAISSYRHQLLHTFKGQSHFSCFFCNKTFEDFKSFTDHSIEHQASMASQSLHINWLQQLYRAYQNEHHINNSPIVKVESMLERSEESINDTSRNTSDYNKLKRKAKSKQDFPRMDLRESETGCVSPASPKITLLDSEKVTNLEPLAVSASSNDFKFSPDETLNQNQKRNHFSNSSELSNLETSHLFDRSLQSSSFEDSYSESSPINLKMRKSHEVRADMRPGVHQCGICQKLFGMFELLDVHCFEKHNRSACMFCTKTFAQRANRDRHLCLHTGKKPYNCSDCDEKFSRGDKLKMHRIRMHGAIYPSRAKDVESSMWSPMVTIKNNYDSFPVVSPSLGGSETLDSSYHNGPEETSIADADNIKSPSPESRVKEEGPGRIG